MVKSLEIHNEDEFYTDINGLRSKKRKIKAIGDYKTLSENLHPVNSFVYIEDKSNEIRMT